MFCPFIVILHLMLFNYNGTHNLYTVGNIIIVASSAPLYVYTNEWQAYGVTKYTAHVYVTTLVGMNFPCQAFTNQTDFRATIYQPCTLLAIDINIDVA